MKTHLVTILTIGLFACGGSKPRNTTPDPTPDTTTATAPAGSSDGSAATADGGREKNNAGEFHVNQADKSSRPKQSKLQATATEAAVRFFVVDKDKGPMAGVPILLTAPDGKKFYTEETDAEGFTEVLLPIGQTYDLTYLSLGRRDVAAKVDVANKPSLNLKLTMRYKMEDYPKKLVLNVEFPTGKANLIGDSSARLDIVVEYMSRKKSAKVEVSGHTDNTGDKKANKILSQKRADAVRDYLVSKGVDASRVTAVGYGDEKPAAPNTTPEGRQQNRRIEAREL